MANLDKKRSMTPKRSLSTSFKRKFKPITSKETYESRELELHIKNNEPLLKREEAIEKNLLKKIEKDTYEQDKATKAFKNLADEGARDYNKQFASSGDRIFSAEDKKQAAKALQESFEKEVEGGSFDIKDTQGLTGEEKRQVMSKVENSGLSGEKAGDYAILLSRDILKKRKK